MHSKIVGCSLLVCSIILCAVVSSAERNPYAGVIGGIATLSADAGSQATMAGLNLSSYAPANGGTLNLFAGIHLDNYFSVQASYIWNRNGLVLNSSSSSTGSFYREQRGSTQQALVFDFLVYFRRRASRIRPYLATGTGVSHFSSSLDRVLASGGSVALPPAAFSSTAALFRSDVGMDVRLRSRLWFRYSFSEIIRGNPIAKQLSPPAPGSLANFQNLFGFLFRF